MVRAIVAAIALFTSTLSAIADEIYFKVCENYQTGQYRSCTEIEDIKYQDFGTVTLHLYSELIWEADGNRSHPDIFLRIFHTDPNGKVTPVANYPTIRAYRWRPSRNAAVTRWRVEATVWRDLPGTFEFQAYTNFSDPEGSLIEQFPIPVLRLGANG